MPSVSDDHVVSPELALVDPALAARSRAAPPVPSTPRPVLRPGPPVGALVSRRAAPRIAAPALMLVATAVASLVVTAFTGAERAAGEPPQSSVEQSRAAPADVSAAPAPAARATRAVTARIRATQSAQPSGGPSAPLPRSSEPAASGGTAVSSASSPAVSSVADEEGPARSIAASATTLVWPRSRPASAYDFELVRGGVVIYSTRSSTPQAVVPRTWSRAGRAYAIQPEDQVFVWPVADGLRRAAPVVDGALALDMTLVSRLIQQSLRRADP